MSIKYDDRKYVLRIIESIYKYDDREFVLRMSCMTSRCYQILPDVDTGCRYRMSIPDVDTGCRYRMSIPGVDTGCRYRVSIPGVDTGCRYQVSIQDVDTGYRYRVSVLGDDNNCQERLSMPSVDIILNVDTEWAHERSIRGVDMSWRSAVLIQSYCLELITDIWMRSDIPMGGQTTGHGFSGWDWGVHPTDLPAAFRIHRQNNRTELAEGQGRGICRDYDESLRREENQGGNGEGFAFKFSNFMVMGSWVSSK